MLTLFADMVVLFFCPCSDHSMSGKGAYREVYEFMTAFLEEKWGKGKRSL